MLLGDLLLGVLLLGVLLLGVVEPNDAPERPDDVRREDEVQTGAVVAPVDAALDVQDTEVAIRVEPRGEPAAPPPDLALAATTSRRATSSSPVTIPTPGRPRSPLVSSANHSAPSSRELR